MCYEFNIIAFSTFSDYSTGVPALSGSILRDRGAKTFTSDYFLHEDAVGPFRVAIAQVGFHAKSLNVV